MEFYHLGVHLYSYRDIVRRIEDRRKSTKTPRKAVYGTIGLTKDAWSRKMSVNETGTGGKKSSFSLDELQRVADFFDAGPGWPFCEWSEASATRDALEALRRLNAPQAEPDLEWTASHAFQALTPQQRDILRKRGAYVEFVAERGGEPDPPPPFEASPAPAEPRKRKTGGGRRGPAR